MKIGVFVSEYRLTTDTLDRLPGDRLGIFLVQNGVYHAAVKDGGAVSPVLDKGATVYAVKEDLETRGYGDAALDERVKVITMGEVVDLMFSDYPKLAWL